MAKKRYTPIPPAVEPGQEGTAAQDRARRRLRRTFIQEAGDVLFQAWRRQNETRKGRGFRERRKRIGGPVERR